MKTKFIKINGITDVTTLIQKASVVDGDIKILGKAVAFQSMVI